MANSAQLPRRAQSYAGWDKTRPVSLVGRTTEAGTRKRRTALPVALLLAAPGVLGAPNAAPRASAYPTMSTAWVLWARWASPPARAWVWQTAEASGLFARWPSEAAVSPEAASPSEAAASPEAA